MQISVIIPALNEERSLATLLPQLNQQQDIELETIVADGGSSDGTRTIAGKHGATLVESAAGRGRQMNAAARAASSDYLLFLHADTSIDDDSLLCTAKETLSTEEEQRGMRDVAGHFSLRFAVSDQVKHPAYHYYEAKTSLNRVNTTNGDQGFFMSRELFDRMNGFDETLPFLEDQRLAEKIRQKGKWITLPGRLTTSARRFEDEGMGRRMIISAIIMGLHDVGFSPFFEAAPQLYRNQRGLKRLRVADFCALIHRLMREAGTREALRNWIGVGRYVRNNAWQLFFPWDVYLGRRLSNSKRPFLWIHDNFFRPLTNSRPWDVVAALLTYAWYRCTWLYFNVADSNRE